VRLLDGTSTRELATFVASQAASTGRVRYASSAPTPADAAALLARLGELTEDEVDDLLRRLQPFA
jgi:hypothetical protein